MKRLGEYITLNLVLFMLWILLEAKGGDISPYSGAILFDAALICLLHDAKLKQFLLGTDCRGDG